MSEPVVKHPRRLGFVVFNAAVLLAVVALVAFLGTNTGSGGFTAVPNTALAATALVILGIVWAGTWLAWGAMVWRRRRSRA